MNEEVSQLYDTKDFVCLICGSDYLEKSQPYYDRRKGLKGSWYLYKCNRCGGVGIYPSPSDAELSEYYSVYSSNKSIKISLNSGSRYPLLRKFYHWITGDVDPRDFINPTANSSMLDYGCGEAGVLFDYHTRGIKISGAELASEIVNECRKAGLDVHQVTNPDKIPFETDRFDIVYLMQVFEHLRNPHTFLDELFRVLNPGGVLYISIPNYKSFWRKLFGKNWVSGWFVPFHLFHYDIDSLSELARQHGFYLIKSWSRTPDSWFRLNLKAFFNPGQMKLDEYHTIIDSNLFRFPMVIVLWIVSLFIRNNDCLVVKFGKH